MLVKALDFHNFMVVLGVRTILPLIASNDERFIPGWLQACTYYACTGFHHDKRTSPLPVRH